MLEKVLKVLKPFYTITLDFSYNTVSVALVIPKMVWLLSVLDKFAKDIRGVGTMVNCLKESVETNSSIKMMG